MEFLNIESRRLTDRNAILELKEVSSRRELMNQEHWAFFYHGELPRNLIIESIRWNRGAELRFEEPLLQSGIVR